MWAAQYGAVTFPASFRISREQARFLETSLQIDDKPRLVPQMPGQGLASPCGVRGKAPLSLIGFDNTGFVSSLSPLFKGDKSFHSAALKKEAGTTW